MGDYLEQSQNQLCGHSKLTLTALCLVFDWPAPVTLFTPVISGYFLFPNCSLYRSALELEHSAALSGNSWVVLWDGR